MARRYYIVQRSHQSDWWKPVAGPFASRKEAMTKVDWYKTTAGPLCNRVTARVVSRTGPILRRRYPLTNTGEFWLDYDLACFARAWWEAREDQVRQ